MLIGISLLVGIAVAAYDRTHGSAVVGIEILTFIGMALFLLAICVGGVTLLTIKKAYSPDPTARKDQALVGGGIYGYVRHPMYTALILVGAGVPLRCLLSWYLP